ncbi:MAG: AMP-binding protein [Promethearchaeota archaeon]
MKLEEYDKMYGFDKSWPKGCKKHLDYPEITLGDLLRQAAKKYPNSDALWFEGFTMTYKELDEITDRFATGLSKLGIKKGDIVATNMPNIPQYLIAHFAIVKLGATTNPILPVSRYVEMLHQVSDSKANTLIILDFLYKEHLLGKDMSKFSSLERIIFTGTAEYLPPLKAKLGMKLGKIPHMENWPKEVDGIECYTFQKVLASGTPANLPKVKIDVKKDAAILIYTGGTTGTPKAVNTSHYNMIANATQANHWANTQMPKLLEYQGKGGMVLVLPLAHSFGNIGMTTALIDGYCNILFPRPPEPLSDILKVIKKLKATYMPGVPTLYNKITQDPKSGKYIGKLKDFVACISGASALPLEVKKKFEAMTGALIVEGYGMSEFSPLMTLNPFLNFKIGTVGLPVSDTYVKIVDAEKGDTILKPCPNESCESCGKNEFQYIGEICGTGPQMMMGYLGRPEETKYALRTDADGITWYYTSDIGCVDSEGYIHIKDRKRDMIKRKGHGVFPREVEDLIYMHDAVNEVGVIGIPDPEVGQEIKAFISLKTEFQGKVSEGDLAKWCQENISPYKYPRQIEIVPELPKSVIGKILRRELRKE